MKKPTLAEQLERIPPFLCFALAKERAPRMSAAQRNARYRKTNCNRRAVKLRKYGWRNLNRFEVAQRGGIPPSTVRNISMLLTWEHVTVSNMLGFLKGCGIELTQLRRTNAYLKQSATRKTMFAGLSPKRFKVFARLAGKKAQNNC